MNTITQIAAAALNSFWQAAILAVLVGFTIQFFGSRWNAATRHVIWWIVLGAIVMLPCIPRREAKTPAAVVHVSPRPAPAPVFPIRVATPLAPPAEPAPLTVTPHRSAVWPWLLLTAWITAFAGRSMQMVRSYLRLRVVKRRAQPWDTPLPAANRRMRLLLSQEISSPIAVGFVYPAVILPTHLPDRLTATELDCVLLH